MQVVNFNQSKDPALIPLNDPNVTIVKSKIYGFMYNISRQMISDSKTSTASSSISIAQVLGMCLRNLHASTEEKVSLLKHIGSQGQTTDALDKAIVEISKDIFRAQESLAIKKHAEFQNANIIVTSFSDLEIEAGLGVEVHRMKNPESVKKGANDLIKLRTKDRIQDLIKNNAELLVINALTFDFLWRTPFKRKATELKPFYINNENGSQTKIDVLSMQMSYIPGMSGDAIGVGIDRMNKVGIKVLDKDNYRVLFLPYLSHVHQYPEDEFDCGIFQLNVQRGDDGIDFPLHQLIILPNETNQKDGKNLLEEINQKLDYQALLSLSQEMREKPSDDTFMLQIPMINLETQPDLMSALSKQGLKFKDPSKVAHALTLKQDEIGTSGAAVTVADIKGGNLKPMIVNRPFLFAIMCNNLVLVQGVVKDEKALVTKRWN